MKKLQRNALLKAIEYTSGVLWYGVNRVHLGLCGKVGNRCGGWFDAEMASGHRQRRRKPDPIYGSMDDRLHFIVACMGCMHCGRESI